MTTPEILEKLMEAIGNLEGIDVRAAGGTIETKTEVEYSIGSHSDTAVVDVEVDLDVVDEYTDLKSESEDAVETARSVAMDLRSLKTAILEEVANYPSNYPDEDAVRRWVSNNHFVLMVDSDYKALCEESTELGLLKKALFDLFRAAQVTPNA